MRCTPKPVSADDFLWVRCLRWLLWCPKSQIRLIGHSRFATHKIPQTPIRNPIPLCPGLLLHGRRGIRRLDAGHVQRIFGLALLIQEQRALCRPALDLVVDELCRLRIMPKLLHAQCFKPATFGHNPEVEAHVRIPASQLTNFESGVRLGRHVESFAVAIRGDEYVIVRLAVCRLCEGWIERDLGYAGFQAAASEILKPVFRARHRIELNHPVVGQSRYSRARTRCANRSIGVDAIVRAFAIDACIVALADNAIRVGIAEEAVRRAGAIDPGRVAVDGRAKLAIAAAVGTDSGDADCIGGCVDTDVAGVCEYPIDPGAVDSVVAAGSPDACRLAPDGGPKMAGCSVCVVAGQDWSCSARKSSSCARDVWAETQSCAFPQ